MPPSQTSSVSDFSWHTLLKLAWPVVVARSTQAVIGFCDALMTAPLGEAALAATTTGALNSFAVVILPMGTIFIIQSLASQLKGKGDYAAARRYAYYGLIVTLITGVLAIVATDAVDPLLRLLDLEPVVHALMCDYLVIRLFAVLPLLGIEVLGSWYGGLGNTHMYMASGIVAMVVNVFCNWLLIQGNWGAPALGVQGAAYASVIASWVSFVGVLALFASQRYVPEKVTGPLKLRMHEMLRMLRFGIPNGINWFLEFAAFTLFINVVVADLGTTVLAATMAVMAVNSVSAMPGFGITSSGAILVGQAIGAGLFAQVRVVVKRTVVMAMVWQGFVGLLYLVFPGFVMSLFAPEIGTGELLEVATVLLMISVAWQLFDAIGMTMSEALRGAGDTAWPMWARLFVAWIVWMPASYLWITIYDGGYVGAMVSVVGYLAVLAAALTYRFYAGAWREIELTGT